MRPSVVVIFVLALAGAIGAARDAAAASILVSGSPSSDDSFSASLVESELSDLGHIATIVSPAVFATQNFAAFDAIWLGGQDVTFSGLSGVAAALSTFVNDGGNLFFEIIENGLPGGENPLIDFPFSSNLTVTHANNANPFRIRDATFPAGANHTAFAGLSDAAFNWGGGAYHSYFTITGPTPFVGIADTGTDDQWVALGVRVGAGYVVYTTQDSMSHTLSGAGTADGDSSLLFANNALTLEPVPAPEPASLALAALSLAGAACRIAGRRRLRPRAV